MIRVLIVDDSRTNRVTLERLLSVDPDVSIVGRAADGAEAIRLVEEHHPDVVTLDLEMPHVNGLTFLRWLMARCPLPVLVVTSRESNYSLFEALELGALDFILKPGRVSPDLPIIQRELIDKIHLLAGMSGCVDPRPDAVISVVQDSAAAVAPAIDTKHDLARQVVVIGASTGGPLALQRIFRRLGADLPAGVLVTQHMPAYSTSFFAERLDEITPLPVREARAGDPVRGGAILIAPGGWHMGVERSEGQGTQIRLDVARDEDRHVPSANRLFSTAAKAFGPSCVGVVLTGMGDDGSRGLKDIQDAGGVTIAESPETAVVYGMPRRAVAAGVVDQIVPLPDIAAEIENLVRRGSEPGGSHAAGARDRESI
ncbi:MAG: chemotaxis-specific protein-glutamate methyltransferase CheB [Acidobacteriota bacterium]